VKSIQRHLTVLQLSRYVGIHYDLSGSQRLDLVAELSRHYDAGLHLGLSIDSEVKAAPLSACLQNFIIESRSVKALLMISFSHIFHITIASCMFIFLH